MHVSTLVEVKFVRSSFTVNQTWYYKLHVQYINEHYAVQQTFDPLIAIL